jgi:hypothetical protein
LYGNVQSRVDGSWLDIAEMKNNKEEHSQKKAVPVGYLS